MFSTLQSPLTADLAIAMLLTGLAGGFGHCLAMCGPLMTVYSIGLKRGRMFFPHLSYNLGRITTYMLGGCFAGLAGSFVQFIAPIERVQRYAMLFTGALLVVVGLSRAGWLNFRLPLRKTGKTGSASTMPGNASISETPPPVFFFPFAGKILAGLASSGAYYPFGMLTGFLPCGLLYGALLTAAGAGVPLTRPAEGFVVGAVLMALFGLGTSVSMLLLGGAFTLGGGWLGGRVYRYSAVLIVLTGGLFLYRAFNY